MPQIEPPPHKVEGFNYIWKEWLNRLWIYAKDVYSELTTHTDKTNWNAHGDSTTGGGPYVIDGNLTIGDGTAGTDYTLTFNGQDADGVLTWMEDEDEFRTSDDFLFSGHVAMGADGVVDTYSVLYIEETIDPPILATEACLHFLAKSGGTNLAATSIGLLAETQATTVNAFNGTAITGIRTQAIHDTNDNFAQMTGAEIRLKGTPSKTGTCSLGTYLNFASELNNDVTVTNVTGIAIGILTNNNSTNCTGLSIAKQNTATNNYGIALAGDGTGADIVFGAGKDATIYYDSTDLVIDPDLIGTGKVLIGATGDDDMKLNAIEIDGDLNHDGSNIGFFGTTPIAKQTTTSQTPATFTANTSGIADDTATWNGYTIGDVVAILQAYGLLT